MLQHFLSFLLNLFKITILLIGPLKQQQLLGTACVSLNSEVLHHVSLLTAWEATESPCCCWREALWNIDYVHYNVFDIDKNSYRVLLCLYICFVRGLLDRSTARYFYKGPKTSLHKHTGNLVENLFSKKCAFENYLQLLT